MILYTRRSFIIIYIYDEKKHIWFQILHTVFLASVLECYILLLIFYIFIMFLQNLYGLINLMKLIHWLWLNILMEHMATARAEVNMNFLTDHILCY